MVSLVLAGLSMFLVHPDRKYISYIDWHSITLLFCLMAVMAGFKETGLFRTIGNALLAHVHTTRQLFLVLVLLPFVFSMFITNDVSLITFVPFAIIVLSMSEKEHLIIPVVVMQTIAANLGSMLMPMGNPQNLYLYAKSGMSLGTFAEIMLPFTIASLLGILLSMFFIKQHAIVIDRNDQSVKLPKKKDYPLQHRICAVPVECRKASGHPHPVRDYSCTVPACVTKNSASRGLRTARHIYRIFRIHRKYGARASFPILP